ncbi:cellulose-binding domain-containing protein [Streptomyces sp. NBC_00433]
MSRGESLARPALRASRLLVALLLLAVGAVVALSGASAASAAPRAAVPAAGGTGKAACTAALTVSNAWQGGYQADVTVTALRALTSWTVTLTGIQVTQAWNVIVVTNPDGSVIIHSGAWNGNLAAGASTTFGFLASSAPPPPPTVTCSTP